MAVRQIDAEQKRLGILSDDEVEALYGRPQFTYEERRMAAHQFLWALRVQ